LELRLQTSTQWGAIKKIIATQPGVRYRVKLGYVHGGSVGGGMEVYNGGVESTQSIGGSGWLNKTTERVFEFVPDSDMVMLKFFSGEVSGVDVNLYLSKVEISIANSNHYSRIRGDKTYELSNHLGNVLATITDRKLGFSNNTSNNIASHYQAEVTSATDFYPFGSPMSKRSVFDYKSKYGFNGQEKENEITELTGTHYSAEFWMYDSRLGRRWNLDPVVKEFESGYAVMGGNPIVNIDPKGDDWFKNNKTGEIKYFEITGAWSEKEGWTRLGQHRIWFTDVYFDLIDFKPEYENPDLYIFGKLVSKGGSMYGKDDGTNGDMSFKQGYKIMLGTATIVFTLGTAGPLVSTIMTTGVTSSTILPAVSTTVSLANGVFGLTADKSGLTFMDKQNKTIQLSWNLVSLASSFYSIGVTQDKFASTMASKPGFNKESAKMLWNFFNLNLDLVSTMQSLQEELKKNENEKKDKK
jgi:RHS repeat-associated protein